MQSKCPHCAYSPTTDTATLAEHAAACRVKRAAARASGWEPEYTAAPNCVDRRSHHNFSWCDTCKGVA